jgi:hypothetical protein
MIGYLVPSAQVGGVPEASEGPSGPRSSSTVLTAASRGVDHHAADEEGRSPRQLAAMRALFAAARVRRGVSSVAASQAVGTYLDGGDTERLMLFGGGRQCGTT